jgi:hypothetical protein
MIREGMEGIVSVKVDTVQKMKGHCNIANFGGVKMVAFDSGEKLFKRKRLELRT